MIAMLRRRLMSGGKKVYMITVKDTTVRYKATDIYPLINGAQRGDGVYEVKDGDVITLYAKGNHTATYPAFIRVNNVMVARTNAPYQLVSYQYVVRSNCELQIYGWPDGDNYAYRMETFLNTI